MSVDTYNNTCIFNNFKSIFNTKDDSLISKRFNILYDRYRLLLDTNMLMMDIVYEVNKQHNISHKYNQRYRDNLQHTFKNCGLKQGLTINDLKNRYSDLYEDVEERMFVRIELYKEGWNIEQIEKYIDRYLFKKSFKNEEITDKYIYFFIEVMTLLNIKPKSNNNKVGRPSIGEPLREYLKNKTKNKIKVNMRNKYSKIKEYDNIKKYLFTDKERDYILSLIEENSNLKDKVSNLTL